MCCVRKESDTTPAIPIFANHYQSREVLPLTIQMFPLSLDRLLVVKQHKSPLVLVSKFLVVCRRPFLFERTKRNLRKLTRSAGCRGCPHSDKSRTARKSPDFVTGTKAVALLHAPALTPCCAIRCNWSVDPACHSAYAYSKSSLSYPW